MMTDSEGTATGNSLAELEAAAQQARDAYLEHRQTEPYIPHRGPVSDEQLEAWGRWAGRQAELRRRITELEGKVAARRLRKAGIW